MITLLGSLLGFGTSIIPQILGFFRKSKDQEHELKLMDKRMEMATKQSELKVDEWNVRADIEEIKQLYKHDRAIHTDNSFINALRASIRPVITYFFFFLFLFIKGFGFYAALNTGIETMAWDNITYVDIYVALDKIWDNNTQAIFSAVIGFWFGSRAIDKAKKG